jgi:hypothetical protein
MKKYGKKSVVDLKARSVEDNTGLTTDPATGYPYNERSYTEEYVPSDKPSIHSIGEPNDPYSRYPHKLTFGGDDTLAARHNRRLEEQERRGDYGGVHRIARG